MTIQNGQGPLARPTRVSPPPSVVAAWQTMVSELGRFPVGTRKKDASTEDLVKILAKAEKGNIMDLRETFTQDRSHISKKLLSNKRHLVAYLLGFHLANAARLQITLSRLHTLWPVKNWCLDDKAPITVTDLGCGAGAMAQGWLAYLKSLYINNDRLAFKLVDSSQLLVGTARDLLHKMEADVSISTIKSTLEGLRLDMPAPEGLAIYSMGYVWNEIGKNRKAQQNLLRHFSELVKQDRRALVTIVEPATQNESRSMMQLRDNLVEAGFVALYPCPHSQGCPMLERSRDWCYSEFDWRRPEIQEFIDHITGADRLMLAASSYVFATPQLVKEATSSRAATATIVGRPHHKNQTGIRRQFDYLLCEPTAELTKVAPIPNARAKQRGDKL